MRKIGADWLIAILFSQKRAPGAPDSPIQSSDSSGPSRRRLSSYCLSLRTFENLLAVVYDD